MLKQSGKLSFYGTAFQPLHSQCGATWNSGGLSFNQGLCKPAGNPCMLEHWPSGGSQPDSPSLHALQPSSFPMSFPSLVPNAQTCGATPSLQLSVLCPLAPEGYSRSGLMLRVGWGGGDRCRPRRSVRGVCMGFSGAGKPDESWGPLQRGLQLHTRHTTKELYVNSRMVVWGGVRR